MPGEERDAAAWHSSSVSPLSGAGGSTDAASPAEGGLGELEDGVLHGGAAGNLELQCPEFLVYTLWSFTWGIARNECVCLSVSTGMWTSSRALFLEAGIEIPRCLSHPDGGTRGRVKGASPCGGSLFSHSFQILNF